MFPVQAVDVYLFDGSGVGRDGDFPSRPAAGERTRAARPGVPAASGEPPVVAPPEQEPVDPALRASVPPPSASLPAEGGAPSSIPAEFLGGVEPAAGNGTGNSRGDVHDAMKGVGAGGSSRAGIVGPPSSSFAEELEGEGGRGGAIGLLRERIQSRIVYPSEAVRRGLEGEVLLRIHIETGGVPNEIRVARSSGARLLDDAARRGVVRAAPLPSSPGWVEVPVRFRLR